MRDNAGGGSTTAGSLAATANRTNAAPIATIAAPLPGAVYSVRSVVPLAGSCVDSDAGETHIAFWTISIPGADPVVVPGVVSGGLVTGSYVFPAAGAYQVSLTVTDSSGASGTAATAGDAGVVVYGPAAGKVIGGGWFQSPAGASADPCYTGRAVFGFNAQYKPDASVPTGQLEFRVGQLNFHSTAFRSLVVRDGRVRLTGMGTINGRSGYSFRLTFVDHGRAAGPDRLRVRIWNTDSGSAVFDSGARSWGDDAEGLTVLSGGNTSILN